VADCSGRSALLGRQLGLRQRDPRLHKVALYRHYADAIHSTGEDTGPSAIDATAFGWRWMNPFEGGAAAGAR
jgi:hypothetical protein